MARTALSNFAVRPRTLVLAIVVVLALAGAGLWYWLQVDVRTGRVDLVGFSAEDTGTVSFAGAFPAQGAEPLANPIGIAWDGTSLYIAESDAGRIRVVDAEGGAIGTIGIPAAGSRDVVYPSAIAVTDDGRLAVVDNAAERVIVIRAEPTAQADTLVTLSGPEGATMRPTSVVYSNGEIFVYDAAAQLVHVFDAEGALARTIGDAVQPRPSVVSSMCVAGNTLYLADSNAGRVLGIDVATGAQRTVFPDRYPLPRSVVAVGKGRLAVLDTFDRAAYIVSAEGVREAVIDAESVPEGILDSPRAATWLADDGRLYVTDATSGAVFVYNVRFTEGQ